MPITGVFFVPSNPNASTALGTITERLHSSLADEPILIGRWALEHKLMRDTPSCLPASASQQRPAQPRYMQFLSLTYYPNHGFIYTSEPEKAANSHPHPTQNAPFTPAASSPVNPPPAGQTPTPSQPGNTAKGTTSSPMVMTTVPLPSCTTLFQHFVYACQPFWCHRHTVTVLGGMVYDVGDFRIRVGDVRQTQPTGRVRGTVVEIEWRGPSLVGSISAEYMRQQRGKSSDGSGGFLPDGGDADDDSTIDVTFPAEGITDADVDAEYAATAALIREFWGRLGVENAREATLVPDIGKEVKGQLHKLKVLGKLGSHRRVELEAQPDEDPDPDAGADVARQFMEILRFNR